MPHNNLPVGHDQENVPDRKIMYKNSGKTNDDLRRRRNEVTIELRKAHKDDQLLKRRNMSSFMSDPTSPLQENNTNIPTGISEIVAGINSNDENQRYLCTQAARKTLSKEKNPPIDVLIEAGVIPKLVEFLTHSQNPSIQFEAAWALTNVASGTSDQTMVVVNAGAIPYLVDLLKSPHPHVSEQAVWALGNIAGDGSKTRDLVLECGAMTPLLGLIKSDTSVTLLRNIVWSISNLCRNKNPPPDFEIIRPCLIYLKNLLYYEDKDVLGDSCWALSYITDGPNEKIQAVIDTGIVQRLVELLSTSEIAILTPALRTVGNIVTGNDSQTESVIAAGGLTQVGHLLIHQKNNIVKEAAWTISNITAGSKEQIQKVIDAGLIPSLLDVLKHGEFRSQKEAAWAITNLVTGGNVEQVSYLVQCGAIPAMCDILTSKEWKTVSVMLDGLVHILQAADKMGQVDKVAIMIEECGGLDKLESLQHHDHEQIYQKVGEIIDTYFMQPEDSSELAPDTGNGQLGFTGGFVPQGGFDFK